MMNNNSVIEKSRDILGGTPVFKGTRVPIRTLMDYLEAGDSLRDFLEDFPTVSEKQAKRALKLAGDALLVIADETAD